MTDVLIEAPPGEPIVVITRKFNAPRELVWKAMSEPQHAVRWWGMHDHKNKVLKWDWRVGGEWSIESTMPGGEKIVFFGEYRAIERPKSVTQTFSFDRLPAGAYSLDSVVLEERAGKTIYRGTSRLIDFESRDSMLRSGMEVGVREGFERLDALLEEFQAVNTS